MKSYFTLIYIFFIQFNVSSTDQISDVLIYNGESILLQSEPLQYYDKIDSLRPIIFKNKSNCSAIRRGYIATWKIIDSQLYLIKLSNCQSFNDTSVKADLQKLFPNDYENGKVNAHWVDGKVLFLKGKRLSASTTSFKKIYEKDGYFTFENGKLKEIIENENKKLFNLIQNPDLDSLKITLQDEIDFKNNKLILNNDIVLISFTSNEVGGNEIISVDSDLSTLLINTYEDINVIRSKKGYILSVTTLSNNLKWFLIYNVNKKIRFF